MPPLLSLIGGFIFFNQIIKRFVKMSALVCFGTLVVEVPDDTYNLADIRELFHAPRGIIRSRKDNKVVATLPFETLPNYDGEEYDFIAVGTTDGDSKSEEGVAERSFDSAVSVFLQSPQASTTAYSVHSLSNATSVVYPPGCYNPFLAKSDRVERWHSSRRYRAAVEPYSFE